MCRLVASGSNALIATGTKAPASANRFDTIVLPNPSRDYFIITVHSSDLLTQIQVKITDAAGKVLEVKVVCNRVLLSGCSRSTKLVFIRLKSSKATIRKTSG